MIFDTYVVPELSATKLSVEHHGLFKLVGFDASHEERVALSECVHQGLQRLFELAGKRRCSLPGLRAHVQVFRENGLQKSILGDVNQLQEIGGKGVTILL